MDPCCGEKLVAVGSAIAIQIAQCTDPDDLSLLGALFTVIGDQLSLLSVTKGLAETSCKKINQQQISAT